MAARAPQPHLERQIRQASWGRAGGSGALVTVLASARAAERSAEMAQKGHGWRPLNDLKLVHIFEISGCAWLAFLLTFPANSCC